jgi:hypothetical protein
MYPYAQYTNLMSSSAGLAKHLKLPFCVCSIFRLSMMLCLCMLCRLSPSVRSMHSAEYVIAMCVSA